MNIDKAIEHLKSIGPLRGTLSEDDIEAIRLSTEALLRIKVLRAHNADEALLGESEE